MRNKVLWSIGLALLLAACGVNVDPVSGEQACAQLPAKQCADGFYCAVDNFCWRDGDSPTPDSDQDVDLPKNEDSGAETMPSEPMPPVERLDGGADASTDGPAPDARRSDAPLSLDATRSVCGNNIKEPDEVCDEGSNPPNELGRCAPDCSTYVDKKFILSTSIQFVGGNGGHYDGNLGGPSGADAVCQEVFNHRGGKWKALLVGGGRRATTTPYMGDNQQDWVIKKYTFYYNSKDELIWRTDALALLGIRDGARVNLFANAHSEGYPWGGWQTDWTEQPSTDSNGTCLGWKSKSADEWGTFPLNDLKKGAGDPCSYTMPLLCVEQ